MIIKSLANIDKNKFRRLRVFGCSLTQWRYPTWADILAQDVPHCDYYNLAWQGAGHQFLHAQYSQWTKRIPLDEQDLVVIQWPSFYREDRYVAHSAKHRPWITPGNIYTQNEYPHELLEVSSRRGFAIRDMAIQDMIIRDLIRSQATALCFNAIDLDLQDAYSGFSDKNATDYTDILEMYSDTMSYNAPHDMLRGLSDDKENPEWNTGYTYTDGDQETHDYHPTVAEHSRFLTDILGATISEDTADWAQAQHNRSLKIKNVNDFPTDEMRYIL